MKTTKDKVRRSGDSGPKFKGGRMKRRRSRGRVLRFILLLFALIYLPALWKWIFHENIETDVLYSDTVEIAAKAEGVFVWKETYVKSPQDGIVIPKVDQGERVPNKYNFAIIVNKDSKRILEEIENLEKNIIRQFAENNPQVLELDRDFSNSVQNEVNKLTDIAVDKNFSSIEAIRKSLENLLYQRNREIFENRGNSLYVADKKRELETLKSKLNETAITVQSDFSGIVVWGVSSEDEKYTPDNMYNLGIDDLAADGSEESDVMKFGYEQAFDVSKDQAFARLISNDAGWYVCTINKKDSGKLKKGDGIYLKIDGINERIPCTVESMDQLGDKYRVIVSFDRYIEKVVSLRHAKANLVIASVEGLKIPQRSLINRNVYDNTADIFVVQANRTVKKRVQIIAEQDSFAIIDSLSDSTDTNPVRIFDIYVVNPQNIEEGQVID